ncbi:MAG TPA: hypothetical protein DCS93_41975 [Microscillaceae bacterium]|nr:hypothetical protein [Microscillaceae bacterium]
MRFTTLSCVAIMLFFITSCQFNQNLDEVNPAVVQTKGTALPSTIQHPTNSIFASGLNSPTGIFRYQRGNVDGFFVVETGTGNNDGRVIFIRQDGTKFPVITDFPSRVRPDGNIEGATHMGSPFGVHLWIANGVSGLIYRYDLIGFNPENGPVKASEIFSDDIRAFVLKSGLVNDASESNIYNLTFDFRFNAYIVDSGANAIIKRSLHGELSVFAKLPSVPNPSGGDDLEPVPTGIVYDGRYWYVSTFLGGQVIQLDYRGKIVNTQSGYTGLVDLARRPNGKLLGVQFGELGQFGPLPNTGALVGETTQGPQTFASGLNFPSGATPFGSNQAMVTSLRDGTITRIDLQ